MVTSWEAAGDLETRKGQVFMSFRELKVVPVQRRRRVAQIDRGLCQNAEGGE